ncbi:MAG: bifunctional 5,10-methylenetetrahydrofolate dehydrogenase/5,10-methenyltetrahydrofolate cyclohydrolase [Candidatus Eremiobacteraeota bacterium]|nr:bifunctional 5,10-methylenetetrahydrofolate dehydrogenase/5,10-methenyltetrahydrofolate cyclohydrolase [Candidatus Eremiobacteraeota bacterium]
MAARILDGRALAAELREEIVVRSSRLRARGIAPCLVVALVGGDAASTAYVRSIEREGAKTGVEVRVDALSINAREDEVRARLVALGQDPQVHGIILQQPLPPHLGIRRIAEAMPPHKDVDGANPVNLGRLAFASGTEFVPATPMAVMLLLERSARWPLRGVRACVVGRSNVVGLPVALLLMARDATVTVTHQETRDLAHHTRDAEIVVVATGVPNLLRATMIAPGATVIDVGTTFVNGTLVGDAAYDEVAAVAGEITPVPGGVGPVTNVALMRNVALAAERQSPE